MNFKKLSEGEVLALASKIKGAIICNTLRNTPQEALHEVSRIFGNEVIAVRVPVFPGQLINEELYLVFEK